jgi:uncharacterized protein
MKKSQPEQSPMSSAAAFEHVALDRIFRKHELIEGAISPILLPGLADFLAGDEGTINYRISGKVVTDQVSSQKRKLKCIISGWFQVFDPVTLAPSRHALNVSSNLVVVTSEQELPALEDESDEEDYIVSHSSSGLDIAALVEEEVLLALPTNLPTKAAIEKPRLAGEKVKADKLNRDSGVDQDSAESKRPSPFAKLAVLKKNSS